jgi:hypothetical protein
MQEELVTFQVAKLAKEKGFNIFTGKAWIKKEGQALFFVPVYTGVTNGIDYHAPTQSLLQKWLREVHNIHIDINTMYLSKGKCWDCYIGEISGESSIWNKEVKGSYEEALEVGLQEALKLIKV